MHADPTFEQAYRNLEREKRGRSKAQIQRILKKQRIRKRQLKAVLKGK